MTRRALITGITGQDGSYLSELLLAKGYEVHGVVRRASTFNTGRIQHLYRDPHEAGTRLFLHYGDLTDGTSLSNLILTLEPDEIYNLGAQSHVRVSFDQPLFTVDVDALGTLRILEAARQLQQRRPVRIYQASSSEMFGKVREIPQRETTPFHPRSPYACAKVFSFYQTVNYREAYGLHASNGILFNHESPLRGETFVTRKITRGATRIREGLQDKLYLGNLDAKRDWGFAKDYVEAMWLMLQQDEPDDYVIATGETHSVREFLELTFEHLDLQVEKHVEVDSRYFRPSEVDLLLGDAEQGPRTLGLACGNKFSRTRQAHGGKRLGAGSRGARIDLSSRRLIANKEQSARLICAALRESGIFATATTPRVPSARCSMPCSIAGRMGAGCSLSTAGAAGMVRLALVDLSDRGQQPLWSADRRVAIIFNGEIYNFRAERERLEQRGVQFRTTTDTEVILNLYLERGLDFVERLRGMFALAIFDWRECSPGASPVMVLARGPLGIKPLYVAAPSRRFQRRHVCLGDSRAAGERVGGAARRSTGIGRLSGPRICRSAANDHLGRSDAGLRHARTLRARPAGRAAAILANPAV